ncbi:MAG: GGDEF domain-containing protein [Clostridia bacterium]|nr:GGDEF domain-containing protein [Clostridia bacterium]
MKRNTGKSNVKNGISSIAIIIPIALIVAVMHSLIIYLIFSISRESGKLSATMRQSGEYTMDAMSILGGSSILSETALNFVLMPVSESGELNLGPLAAYAGELSSDRRGYKVAERFKDYDVSDEVRKKINEAAVCANNMMNAQLKAIALVVSIYPLPDIPILNGLVLPELTAEEKSMTEPQKLQTARTLVLGSEYSLNKQTVSQSTNAAVDLINEASAAFQAKTAPIVVKLRSELWIITIAIILILIVSLILIYKLVLSPLGLFVRRIASDSLLDEKKGLKEVRLVAGAYNEISRRKAEYNDLLLSAAETDALTSLPNRYAFQQCLIELGYGVETLAIIVFDINFLKLTNDNLGHASGDKLIKDSAEIISNSFNMSGRGKCFRLGGDEFASVIKNASKEELDCAIVTFDEEQKNKGVSISWGVAFTDDVESTTTKNLIHEADMKMYENKKKVHGSSDKNGK